MELKEYIKQTIDFNKLKQGLNELYDLDITNIKVIQREDRRPCYIVDTDKGKYFVKVYDDIDIFKIEGLKLLDYLNSKNYPTIKPIKSKRGNYIEVIDNTILALFEYAEGEQVSSTRKINNERAINLGRALGLLHKLTKGYNFPEDPEGPTTIQWTLSGLYKYRDFVNRKLQEWYKRIYNSLIEELKNTELNTHKSVVHGEFTFEHVWFKEDNVYKVIDWDNVNYSYSILDLGITLTFTLLDFGEKYMKLVVKGYEKERKLEKGEDLNFALIYGMATFTWWFTSDSYLGIYNFEDYPKETAEKILNKEFF